MPFKDLKKKQEYQKKFQRKWHLERMADPERRAEFYKKKREWNKKNKDKVKLYGVESNKRYKATERARYLKRFQNSFSRYGEYAVAAILTTELLKATKGGNDEKEARINLKQLEADFMGFLSRHKRKEKGCV